MSKTRRRPVADRANRESNSQKLTATDCTRVPPHTPAPIAKALSRTLRRLDDLADIGANVSVVIGFTDERGQRTGIVIVDVATLEAIGEPPYGMAAIQVGTAVQA